MKNITLLVAATFCAATIFAQQVGIGTVSPVMDLHVSSATDSTLLLLENRATLGVNVNSALYLKTGALYTGAVKTVGTGTSSARLGLYTYAVASEQNLRERISITDFGNVGINIISPSTTLDINGSFRLRGNGAGAGKVLTSDGNGIATWQTPVAVATPTPAFFAYLTNTVALGNGVLAAVTGFTEEYDEENNFEPSTGRFTAPTDGVYNIGLNMNFNETGTDTKYITIYVNKNNGIWVSFSHIVAGINSNASSSFNHNVLLKLVAGEYISLSLTRSAASGNTLRGGTTANATFFYGS